MKKIMNNKLAIGIICIITLGAGYFFSDKYVTEPRIVEQEKAQKKIEKNVQEATFELEDLSLINVVASTESENEEIIIKSFKPFVNFKLFIIFGLLNSL